LPEPRLFVSAGDTSGDQHAAALVDELRPRLPGLQVEGLGGSCLARAGVALHADLVAHAIFGIRPAVAAAPALLGLLRRVSGAFDRRRPDAVVLVDYPGLNLFVARLAHRRGIPVLYFIAPQLWAWAPWRVRRFARVVDEALVLFPFEQAFFERAGLPAVHVGHPLLDRLPDPPPRRADIAARPRAVALLPGSRPREVATHMPLLLAAAARLLERHPDCSFHSAHVSDVERAHVERAARAAGIALHVHGDDVHGVMASCRCALVASGTATLETAMFGTPLVVFYRITPLEERMRRWLLVPPFVGMVNLVAGRRVTPEVLLSDTDPRLLVEALDPLLDDTEVYRRQRQDLAALRARHLHPGAIGLAAARVAERLQPQPAR